MADPTDKKAEEGGDPADGVKPPAPPSRTSSMASVSSDVNSIATPIQYNKDGSIRKKRGRKPKNKLNDDGSDLSAVATAAPPTKRARLTRKSAGSETLVVVSDQANTQEQQAQATTATQKLNPMEHIRQQQAKAHAKIQSVLPVVSEGKGHGKTTVSTPSSTNQHPLQGTVAPHGSFPGRAAGMPAPHSMSPRTMAVLLKGNALSVSEDMAMSSLPVIAGGGVLAGRTMTGPAAGVTTGGKTSRGQVGAKGLPKSETAQQQQYKKLGKLTKQTKRKGNVGKRRGSVSSSNGSNQQRRGGPSITIPDIDPARFVNPLLDLPPPVLPNAGNRQTSTGTIGVVGSALTLSNPDVQLKNILAASELHAWMTLVFPRPDTFSIATYARLLGYDVPLNAKIDDSKSWIPKGSTSLPFQLITDSISNQIPPEGQFGETVWKEAYSNYNKDDDSILGGRVDPMYESFLAGSEDWTTAPGTTSNQFSRLKNLLSHQNQKLKQQKPSSERINAVLKEAEELGLIDSEKFSVAHVSKSSTTSATAFGTAAAAATSGVNDGTGTVSTGVSVLECLPSSGASFEKPNIERASSTAKTEAEAADPISSEPNPEMPPSAIPSAPVNPSTEPKPSGSGRDSMWGFVAWHKDRDENETDLSMVLHYQLQWFHFYGSKVAEMVMRIPFGPVPAVAGDPNLSCPPKVEKDHFAEDEKNDKDSLPRRQRLIIILYALTLEHARNADVYYCLLQVPASLVPLLQKFFRMTPVVLDEKAIGSEKRTSLVPMLCDLNKCSTKYALLLQKETLEKSSDIGKGSSTMAPTPILKERLLVQLPMAHEVKDALKAPQITQVQPAKQQESKQTPQTAAGPTELVKDDATQKKEQLEQPPESTETQPNQPQPHSISRSNSQEAMTFSERKQDNLTTAVSVGRSTRSGMPAAMDVVKKFGGATISAKYACVRIKATIGPKTNDSSGDNSAKGTTNEEEGEFSGNKKKAEEIMTLQKLTKNEGNETWDPVAGPVPSTSVTWNILKAFPVGNVPQVSLSAVVAPTSSQRLESLRSKNDILIELEKKQKQLKVLESEYLHPKIEQLMVKVIEERREYESSGFDEKQAEAEKLLEANQKMLARRKEFDELYQKQLDEDMEAVCSICYDGDVFPSNAILFCEACNVAVHQQCYGVEVVPEGDYYCLACKKLNRQKVNSAVERQMRYQAASAAVSSGETDIASFLQQRTPIQTLPICCELCPLKNGAFVPADSPKRATHNTSSAKDSKETTDSTKWVHMICAKWQGLNFVEKAKPDLLVEDVSELKLQFRLHRLSCSLCLGDRGAFNKCREEGCNEWLHVLCARFSGLCNVVHGENARGGIETNPWTLLCPKHSNMPFPLPENVQRTIIPVEKLVLMSKSFPPEPKIDPRFIYANSRPDKPFNKLTGEERRNAFANPQYEKEVIEELFRRISGVRCEVCDIYEEDGKSLNRCQHCGIVFCDSCHVPGDNAAVERRTRYKCVKCSFLGEQKRQKKNPDDPECAVCCQKGGWLRKATAKPVSMKVWKSKTKLAKSLFGQQLWCHGLCSLWCAPGKLDLNGDTALVDLTQVILSNGHGFIKPKDLCFLCGNTKGLKEPCAEEECCYGGEGTTPSFHPSCARQAGMEVKDSTMYETLFYVKCYRHGGAEFNLRARLDDLIEIEIKRAGKGFPHKDAPMTFADANRLLNGSILVMRILGWAWRWSEWWVEHGSNWEPLLEPGQNERNMTKEELKIVDSTRESRREDARRCRLASFGAALRNRNYDVEDDGSMEYNGGINHLSLERALRAVLHTKSLVGPLEGFEIDFLIEWLGRAYRSKSRLLGFGDDKIEAARTAFCLHHDGSPKFELGERPLPGAQDLPEGRFFENPVNEPDDFEVYSEDIAKHVKETQTKPKVQCMIAQPPPPQPPPQPKKSKKLVKQAPAVHHDARGEATGKRRGPGRPPKSEEQGKRRGPGRPPRKPQPSEVAPAILDVSESLRMEPSKKKRKRDADFGDGDFVADEIEGAPESLVSVKRGPGRPPRKRLAAAASPRASRPESDIGQSGLYSAVKKRERRKPEIFSSGPDQIAEVNSEEEEAEWRPRRRPARPSRAALALNYTLLSEDDTSSDEDVPIADLVARANKGLSGREGRVRKAIANPPVPIVAGPTPDILLLLPDAAQAFLASVGISSAEDVMTSRTTDLGHKFADWRKEQGMPALKGLGSVASVSSWKGQIRKIARRRGLYDLAVLEPDGLLPSPRRKYGKKGSRFGIGQRKGTHLDSRATDAVAESGASGREVESLRASNTEANIDSSKETTTTSSIKDEASSFLEKVKQDIETGKLGESQGEDKQGGSSGRHNDDDKKTSLDEVVADGGQEGTLEPKLDSAMTDNQAVSSDGEKRRESSPVNTSDEAEGAADDDETKSKESPVNTSDKAEGDAVKNETRAEEPSVVNLEMAEDGQVDEEAEPSESTESRLESSDRFCQGVENSRKRGRLRGKYEAAFH